MKTTIFSSIAICTMALFACQSPSSNKNMTNDSVGSINQAPDNTARDRENTEKNNMAEGTKGTVDDKTHNFINEAAMGGMAEVELGKLAQEKAMSQRVKNFGEMMVRDHSAVNDDLKAICRQKNVTPPSDMGKHKDHYNDLSKKNGAFIF